MFKLALRNLLTHKFRFLLTAFSVVLGVGFVVGSFVLTDSLKKSFDDLFTQATSGLDLSIRAKSNFEDATTQRAPIPEDILDEIQAVPGVSIAEGEASGYAQIVDKNGKAATTQGAPLLGGSWTDAKQFSVLKLVSGKEPSTSDEVAIDSDTAEDLDLTIGDRVTVLLEGPSQIFTISGIISFGEKNQLAGARLTIFDLKTAQNVLGNRGTYDSIAIAISDDADIESTQSAITAVLPKAFEVVNRQIIVDENLSTFNGFINVFGNALLGFAGIALFVSAFVIANTFNIIVGQRTRELALLRAIGATPRQIRTVMLTEAFAVGMVATALGLGFGLLIAQAIRGIFDASGSSLPDSSTVIAPRTIVVAVIVGIGVTVVASLLPSRKASRIPPMAALHAELISTNDHTRARVVAAFCLTVSGVMVLVYGLFISDQTSSTWAALAIGSMLFFLGIAAFSIFIARPVAHALGFLYPRFFGMTGVLARENAARNPSRTASAASALMIGLALVSMVSVIGNSIKETLIRTLRNSTHADLIIQSDSFTSFSTELASDLGKLPEIDAVGRLRVGQIRINNDTKQVAATDAKSLDRLVNIGIKAGKVEGLSGNGVLVHQDPARDLNLSVGDPVTATFPVTGDQELQVAGIYDDATLMGNWIIGMDTYESNMTERLDFIVFARISEGVPANKARSAAEAVTKKFPQTTLRDQQEYQDKQASQLDQFLAVINALLGLAIIIALLGIINTLALSVFERTRELGLLRAIGMSRRQVRRMIRWEAVLISIFGGLAGAAIGILFGVALGYALPDSLIKTVTVPGNQIMAFIIISGFFGLLAGYLPARRAAKLDILTAIAAV